MSPRVPRDSFSSRVLTSQLPLIHRNAAQLSLNSFEIGRKLGRGKFGRVYLARTRAAPHFIVALKCLWKHEIVKDRVEKQVRREIEIQQNLRWARSKRAQRALAASRSDS